MRPHQRLYRSATLPVYFASPGFIERFAGPAEQRPASQAKRPAINATGAAKIGYPPGRADQEVRPLKIIQVRYITGKQLLANRPLRPVRVGLWGRTVTSGQLRAKLQRYTKNNHQNDYALAYGYLPNLTTRYWSIRIAVIELHYDHVAANDQAYFSNNTQAHQILGLYKGQPIRSSVMQQGLITLNRSLGPVPRRNWSRRFLADMNCGRLWLRQLQSTGQAFLCPR